MPDGDRWFSWRGIELAWAGAYSFTVYVLNWWFDSAADFRVVRKKCDETQERVVL
jgi:hypothetical protein